MYRHKKAEDGIAGVEIALWNDRYVDNEQSLRAQNSVYTTLLALAERSWHGGGEEYSIVSTPHLHAEDQDFE